MVKTLFSTGLALLFVICSQAPEARAAGLLTADQFRRLPRTQKAQVLKAYIDFLEKYERSERFQSASTASEWLNWLNDASAQDQDYEGQPEEEQGATAAAPAAPTSTTVVSTTTSTTGQAAGAPPAQPDPAVENAKNEKARLEHLPYDCVYAGWPSVSIVSGGKRLCTNPSRGNPDYAKYSAACKGAGQMACNPALFGAGVCTQTGNYAFSGCVSAFKRGGRLEDVADKVASDENLSRLFNEVAAQVDKTCHNASSFQKPTPARPMCVALERQVQSILKPGQAKTDEVDQKKAAAEPAPASAAPAAHQDAAPAEQPRAPAQSAAASPQTAVAVASSGKIDIGSAIACLKALPNEMSAMYPDEIAVLPVGKVSDTEFAAIVFYSKNGHDDARLFKSLKVDKGVFPTLMTNPEKALPSGESVLTDELRKSLGTKLIKDVGMVTEYYKSGWKDAVENAKLVQASGKSYQDVLSAYLKDQLEEIEVVFKGDQLSADTIRAALADPKNTANRKQKIPIIAPPRQKDFVDALDACAKVKDEPGIQKAVEAERVKLQAVLKMLDDNAKSAGEKGKNGSSTTAK